MSQLLASEPTFPLWDGHESVADYAKPSTSRLMRVSPHGAS
jgi:hypothetical protein